MAARHTTKKLREAVDTLRVLCPTQHPVQVRRCQMAPDYGDVELTKKGRRCFKIRLSAQLPIDFQVWVLVHEWAHCMTWTISHHQHDDHGAFFGIAYAEAYKAIYS